jgi:hypothetical protein
MVVAPGRLGMMRCQPDLLPLTPRRGRSGRRSSVAPPCPADGRYHLAATQQRRGSIQTLGVETFPSPAGDLIRAGNAGPLAVLRVYPCPLPPESGQSPQQAATSV